MPQEHKFRIKQLRAREPRDIIKANKTQSIYIYIYIPNSTSKRKKIIIIIQKKILYSSCYCELFIKKKNEFFYIFFFSTSDENINSICFWIKKKMGYCNKPKR